MNKIAILWVSLICSTVGMLYCALWAIQSAWLSATPNYPLEKAQFNFNISATLTVVFLILSFVIGYFLYKVKKSERDVIERIKTIEDKALSRLRNYESK